MDAVGGVINAFTSKEHTCYYAKVLDENLPLAIDLLTDIFLHSSFDAEEIERERSVILQEMSQAEDTPDDYVHDLFSLDFFKDHPIGRPICGREATVNSFHREDFLSFFKARYRPRRVIVAAAGNIGHDALVKEMAARLGKVSDRRRRSRRPTRWRAQAGDGQRRLSPRQRIRTGPSVPGHGRRSRKPIRSAIRPTCSTLCSAAA